MSKYLMYYIVQFDFYTTYNYNIFLFYISYYKCQQ